MRYFVYNKAMKFNELEQKDNLDVEANVYFIETMGMFDGPGTRYVLFLQGCPLKCKFCHNRDSWSTKTNKIMTVKEILDDYERYAPFYRRGGITVSGGEPTLQIDFLIALFQEAKKRNIHTCLDTSAGIFNEKTKELHKELFKYTDIVLLDLKHIDDEAHKDLVGVSNKRALELAKYLDELQVDVIVRHVLIPGITAVEEHLRNLRKFIDGLTNIIGLDVLPYHTAGRRKWIDMGLKYELEGVREPTSEEVKFAEAILKDNYNYKKRKN